MLDALAGTQVSGAAVAQAVSSCGVSALKDVFTPLISLAALVVSMYTYRVNAVLARQPVLVFVYDSAKGWVLQNVGSGTAMDVTVLQGKRPPAEVRELLSPMQQIDKEVWFNPVRLPPLAKDGQFDLEYLHHVNDTALGVTYQDTERRKYTTKCSVELNEFFYEQPLNFPDEPITPHWANPPVRHAPPPKGTTL